MRYILSLFSLLILSSVSFSIGTSKDLIDINRLYNLEYYESFMVSSYDRTGGNDDGFNGIYSFVRKEENDLVIFEEQGPGVIRRIWTPNLELTGVHNNSKVSVYIDGELVLFLDSFLDFFNGKVYPFQKPFIGMQMGAAYSYIPIPFEKSCKIVVHGEKFYFYQINWDRYSPDTKIKSFNNLFKTEYINDLESAKKSWENIGKYPFDLSKNAKNIKINNNIKGNKSSVVAKISNAEGKIVSFKIKLKSEDSRAFRKTILKVHVDDVNSPIIISPVGDFFLDGFNQNYSKSLLLGINQGEYYCYLPMPFKNNIEISLENQSDFDVKVEGSIIWEEINFDENTGYLYAFWHRENKTPYEKPFQILNASGRGKWIGVSHAMQGNPGDFGYLEGDEIAEIDDRDGSYYHGTGTEDYFNGGWYFVNTDNAPLHGCGVLDSHGRCLAFRLHFADPVPFKSKANITIEHGHNNEYMVDYAGVTYFYGDANIKYDGFNNANLIPQSVSVLNAIEAEDNELSDCIIIDDTKENFTYSGGKAVATYTSAKMRVNVPCSGKYNVKAFIIGNPEILIDGNTSGVLKGEKGKLVNIEKNKYLKEGLHEIEIKALKQRKAIVDYFLLEDSGKPIEAEKLEIFNPKQGEIFVAIQDLKPFGGKWSKDAQIFSMSKEVGDFYEIIIPTKGMIGKYMMSAYFTMASDYGIIRVYADGNLLSEFDGFKLGVSRSNRISLGEINITSDIVKIKVEVSGKNPNSTGYYSGIDCFYLENE